MQQASSVFVCSAVEQQRCPPIPPQALMTTVALCWNIRTPLRCLSFSILYFDSRISSLAAVWESVALISFYILGLLIREIVLATERLARNRLASGPVFSSFTSHQDQSVNQNQKDFNVINLFSAAGQNHLLGKILLPWKSWCSAELFPPNI